MRIGDTISVTDRGEPCFGRPMSLANLGEFECRIVDVRPIPEYPRHGGAVKVNLPQTGDTWWVPGHWVDDKAGPW